MGDSFNETTGAEYRKEYAMEPGTKGKLDFFIKPYEAGYLSLDFSLDISPFHIETDKPVTVGNNTAEAGLLSGHILYFLGEKQSDENTIKYTWIKDGKFQIKIQNAKKDTKYNYSIYWVWPLNLSTILLNNGDEFLNESDVEFDDKDSTGKLRNTIVTDMTKHPEKYFFSSLTGQPLSIQIMMKYKKFPKFMKTAERLMVHMTNSFFRHLYSNPRSEERSIRQNLPVGDFLAKRTG